MKRLIITAIRVIFTLLFLSVPFYIIGAFVSFELNPLNWLALTTSIGRLLSAIPIILIIVITIGGNMRVWKKENIKEEIKPAKSKWEQKLEEIQKRQQERTKANH